MRTSADQRRRCPKCGLPNGGNCDVCELAHPDNHCDGCGECDGGFIVPCPTMEEDDAE